MGRCPWAAFNVLPPPEARLGVSHTLRSWPTGGGPSMIRPTRTHRQYLEFVQTRREQLDVKVPHDATSLWCKSPHRSSIKTAAHAAAVSNGKRTVHSATKTTRRRMPTFSIVSRTA